MVVAAAAARCRAEVKFMIFVWHEVFGGTAIGTSVRGARHDICVFLKSLNNIQKGKDMYASS